MNAHYTITTSARTNKYILVATGVLVALTTGVSAQTSDPLLNVLIKKGILTEKEAQNIKTEADTNQTNNIAPISALKWKLSEGIKSIELFGDIRLRYEYRTAQAPTDGRIELKRYRYALRFGLRGDLADNFYYGFRLETAANPRSPWVSFGTSSSGTPYQGPFGKSTAGINVGQAYLGWRAASWLDITVGKMPNPLFTTPMVWDGDLNPDGAAEHFKYTVGQADLFANFGQFLYQDVNPANAAPGLVSGLPFGQGASSPFLLAWQAGANYHLDKDISFKAAVTLYDYLGMGQNNSTAPTRVPGFSDPFVGNGAPTIGVNTGPNSDGFFFNQTGINDLLILEIPFQVDFKISRFNARVFGDLAQNLEGGKRATAAAGASAAQGFPFAAQKNENQAYQIGFAIGNRDSLGLVYGTVAKKGMWEARAYWQHIEQYALDPNLLDSDFFEGRANLEGIYSAFAYSFTDNMIGSLRYGYANRINNQLGTGGSNQDIPQVNPVQHFQIFQMDLTYRF